MRLDEERLRKLQELGDDVEGALGKLERRKGTTAIALLKEFSRGDLWIHGYPPSDRAGDSRVPFALSCFYEWSQNHRVKVFHIENTVSQHSHGGSESADFPFDGKNFLGCPTTLDEIRWHAERSDFLIFSNILRYSSKTRSLWGQSPVPRTLKEIGRLYKTGILALTSLRKDCQKPSQETESPGPLPSEYQDVWEMTPGDRAAYTRTLLSYYNPQDPGPIPPPPKFSLEDFREHEVSFPDIITAAAPTLGGAQLQCLKNKGREPFHFIDLVFTSVEGKGTKIEIEDQ
ncbi:MAG: hypothetical protein GF334_00710 [Candidatus Altiarchaeales archaeon]|nr:hypothetical protein [Candidatus Altiarchaeales archaeon]